MADRNVSDLTLTTDLANKDVVVERRDGAAPERVAASTLAADTTGLLSTVSTGTTITGQGTNTSPLEVATPLTADEKAKLAGIEVGAEVNPPDGELVPAGGTAGQVLAKLTSADGDTHWRDAPTGSGGGGGGGNETHLVGQGNFDITTTNRWATETNSASIIWDDSDWFYVSYQRGFGPNHYVRLRGEEVRSIETGSYGNPILIRGFIQVAFFSASGAPLLIRLGRTATNQVLVASLTGEIADPLPLIIRGEHEATAGLSTVNTDNYIVGDGSADSPVELDDESLLQDWIGDYDTPVPARGAYIGTTVSMPGIYGWRDVPPGNGTIWTGTATTAVRRFQGSAVLQNLSSSGAGAIAYRVVFTDQGDADLGNVKFADTGGDTRAFDIEVPSGTTTISGQLQVQGAGTYRSSFRTSNARFHDNSGALKDEIQAEVHAGTAHLTDNAFTAVAFDDASRDLTLTTDSGEDQTVNIPGGTGGGLTEGQVDARVRAITDDFAETGNATQIPEAKIASNITRDNEVEAFARVGNAGQVPDAKIPTEITRDNEVEDFATVGDAAQVPDNKIPATITRDAELPGAIAAGVADWAEAGDTSQIPLNKLGNAPSGGGGGGGLTTAQARSLISDWAEEGNTDVIPDAKLPDIATSFAALTDTPATLGAEGQVPAVNAAGDALVFADPATGDPDELTKELFGNFDDLLPSASNSFNVPSATSEQGNSWRTITSANLIRLTSEQYDTGESLQGRTRIRVDSFTVDPFEYRVRIRNGAQGAILATIHFTENEGTQGRTKNFDAPLAASDDNLQYSYELQARVSGTLSGAVFVEGLKLHHGDGAASEAVRAEVSRDTESLRDAVAADWAQANNDDPIPTDKLTNAPSGSETFAGLTDTPSALGTTGQVPAVNAAGDALEFVDAGSGGGLTQAQVDARVQAGVQAGVAGWAETGDLSNIPFTKLGNQRFTSADETKLEGIEAGAQVNVGVEFTTAEKNKLGGIEVGATADQAGSELVNTLNTALGGTTWQGGGGGGGGGLTVAEVDAQIALRTEDWAEEGSLALIPDAKLPAGIARDSEVPSTSEIAIVADARVRSGVADWAEEGDSTAIPSSKLINQRFTAADENKLAGIETGATADQSGPELVSTINTALGGDAWQAGGGSGGGLTVPQVNNLITEGVEDWAESGNTDALPDSKIPAGVARDTEVTAAIASLQTEAQVDARIQVGVEDWAEAGDTSLIPGSKLTNAPGLVESETDARIRALTEDFAEVGNAAQVSDAKIPSTITRDAEVEDFARVGNTAEIPDDKIPEAITRDAELPAAVAAGVEDWAETGNTERIPANKLGATAFAALTDTPPSLGTAGQVPIVNAAGDALEFVNTATGGVGAPAFTELAKNPNFIPDQSPDMDSRITLDPWSGYDFIYIQGVLPIMYDVEASATITFTDVIPARQYRGFIPTRDLGLAPQGDDLLTYVLNSPRNTPSAQEAARIPLELTPIPTLLFPGVTRTARENAEVTLLTTDDGALHIISEVSRNSGHFITTGNTEVDFRNRPRLRAEDFQNYRIYGVTLSRGGAEDVTDLTDTPDALGTAGQVLAVNAAGDALEFVDAASGSGGGGFSSRELASATVNITQANILTNTGITEAEWNQTDWMVVEFGGATASASSVGGTHIFRTARLADLGDATVGSNPRQASSPSMFIGFGVQAAGSGTGGYIFLAHDASGNLLMAVAATDQDVHPLTIRGYDEAGTGGTSGSGTANADIDARIADWAETDNGDEIPNDKVRTLLNEIQRLKDRLDLLESE